MSDSRGLPVLDGLQEEVERLRSSASPKLSEYKEDLNRINDILARLSESWSGSWSGYHAELYYGDYQKPSTKEMFDPEWGGLRPISAAWRSRTNDEISLYVQINYKGASVEEIEKFVRELVEKCKNLREEECIQVSPMRGWDNFEREKELLDTLEDLKWGSSSNEIVELLKPSYRVSRDSKAVHQGLRVPPHIQYQARIISILSSIEAVEEFLNLSLRLIRQLETRKSFVTKGGENSEGVAEIIRICDRFHSVVRQLRVRHDGRGTVEIGDEYDVQDLLHALLKVFFDDVRPEEWSPSYAGTSSRMDFLLKDQQIVVEVKKTRPNLTDKGVGEQLIIDIAKYRNHPDCHTLICFVYDPEARIGNPRGLENDLAELSNDTKSLWILSHWARRVACACRLPLVEYISVRADLV